MRRLLLSLLLVGASSCAFAGGGGIDMGIEAQNLAVDTTTSVKTTAALIQQAQQVKNQLLSLANQAKNLKNIPNFLWNNTIGQLKQLASIVNQGQALGYSMRNLGQIFQQKYPGYIPQKDYSEAYQNWSTTALDTLQGTLQSAGLQAQQFNTQAQTIEQLNQMAKTETGRQQALEVGNEIAGETVNQMQGLKQLIINQTDAQNTYMAYKVQKEQARAKAQNQYIQKADDQYPAYQDNEKLGEIPSFNQ